MSQTLSDYEAGRSRLESLATRYESQPRDRNEATTRLQLVDELFFDCLGWDRAEGVELEDSENREYADYLFSTSRDVLIVEAKREGVSFELPAGKERIKYSIPSLMRDYPDLKAAIRQVASYCWERGVPYAAVSNGRQVVAFVANRSDGTRPLDGDALVFPSLAFMLSKFLELWQALSKSGISENKLYSRLVRDCLPDLPPKLSASIWSYPGTKIRNVFQADLLNLSELVIEDVTRNAETEKDFLRECYCSSEALSQYSMLSKKILSARYAALFDEAIAGPTTAAIRTTKGITPDLLAESLTRRPVLLLGDVGVGKTMFQRHLILIEAPDLLDNAIFFYINLGVRGTLSSDLQSLILTEIENQLYKSYGVTLGSGDFIRGVYDFEVKLFAKGLFGELAATDPVAYASKEREFLWEKISDRSEHTKRSLQHLSKARKKQVVFFLDNADQRDLKDQERAFLIAQEIAEEWGAAVYVPIRPETFHQSRVAGTLSAYHSKAFTISPPRTDLVLTKRLQYALKFTQGEVPLQLGTGVNFTGKMSALDAIIRAFLHSLRQNSDLLELLDNVSNGNIRLVLDLVKQFFGSGHVDSEKICDIHRANSSYVIPLHEFLRAVMFGNDVYYDARRSPVANLFDITWLDPKEHFLVPLLIGTVHNSKSATVEGFVETRNVYQGLQSLGFAPEQIDNAIARATRKKLLEPPARRVPEPGKDMPSTIRTTAVGLYHINRLCRFFSYVDAVIVDVPVLDATIRKGIQNVISLDDRIQRVMLFKAYLDRSWKDSVKANQAWDWTVASQELEFDVKRVHESDRRQKNR
jgi:hypothetical protein